MTLPAICHSLDRGKVAPSLPSWAHVRATEARGPYNCGPSYSNHSSCTNCNGHFGPTRGRSGPGRSEIGAPSTFRTHPREKLPGASGLADFRQPEPLWFSCRAQGLGGQFHTQCDNHTAQLWGRSDTADTAVENESSAIKDTPQAPASADLCNGQAWQCLKAAPIRAGRKPIPGVRWTLPLPRDRV